MTETSNTSEKVLTLRDCKFESPSVARNQGNIIGHALWVGEMAYAFSLSTVNHSDTSQLWGKGQIALFTECVTVPCNAESAAVDWRVWHGRWLNWAEDMREKASDVIVSAMYLHYFRSSLDD